MEKSIIKGSWFLPVDIDNRVTGTLTFDPDEGIELEIDAPFNELESPFEYEIGQADIILGESRNGELITLVSCFRQNTSWGRSYRATWYANEAYIGCHTLIASDLVFSEVIVQVKPLFLWLNSSGIKINTITTPDLGVTFEYSKPEDIAFEIDDKVSGELKFNVSYSFPSSYSETIDLKHIAAFGIETINGGKLLYTDLWIYAERFLNWLTVATNYTCEIEEVSFYNNDIIEQVLNDGTTIKQEIKRLKKRASARKRPQDTNRFIFDYPKIKRYMPGVITKWFKLYESVEVVMQILAENMGRNVAFNEFHFKDIIQALEAFHRKRFNNERMPKAEYKVFKKRILVQIADVDDRKFIEEQMSYANEPRLRERLSDLIENCNILALKSIVGDKVAFIKLLVDNRNYHTHLDKSGKKVILTPPELFRLSEKALAILFVAIMCEIFPDKDFINQLIRLSKRWGHLVKNQSDLLLTD